MQCLEYQVIQHKFCICDNIGISPAKYPDKLFSYFSMETDAVGTSENRPGEAIFTCTHNICFHGDIRSTYLLGCEQIKKKKKKKKAALVWAHALAFQRVVLW